MKRLFGLGVLLFTGLSMVAHATELTIDTAKSKLTFTADAFFNNVSGEFHTWQGAINFVDGKPLESSVIVKIDTTSIDTQSSMRDGHLRSKSFFFVQQYPEATFVSKKLTPVEGKADTYQVDGVLTIRGVSKEVGFPAEIKKDGDRVTAKASLNINRRDFGINFRSAMNPIKPEVAVNFDVVAAAQAAQ